MGKKTVIAFLLVAFAVTMLLHGCGGSDKDKPATDKPPQGDVKPAQTASSGEPASSSPYANTVLKLGRIPFTNSTAMVHKHNKFLEYLTRKLGVKQVRLQTASNYTEIMNLLIEGKIDIAWLATMTSVEARKNPEIELLVKPIRFGTTSYRGIIIARQDSGIRNLKDLKGKKIRMG